MFTVISLGGSSNPIKKERKLVWYDFIEELKQVIMRSHMFTILFQILPEFYFKLTILEFLESSLFPLRKIGWCLSISGLLLFIVSLEF